MVEVEAPASVVERGGLASLMVLRRSMLEARDRPAIVGEVKEEVQADMQVVGVEL